MLCFQSAARPMARPRLRFAPAMPRRLLASGILGIALMAGLPLPAAAQEVRSRAIAGAGPIASTGDAGCDAAAEAWRACIAASPKLDADKAAAITEVDKFMRDVFDARGPHRPSILGACPRMEEGYRRMLMDGTCRGNVTGARDDQISRSAQGAAAAQR